MDPSEFNSSHSLPPLLYDSLVVYPMVIPPPNQQCEKEQLQEEEGEQEQEQEQEQEMPPLPLMPPPCPLPSLDLFRMDPSEFNSSHSLPPLPYDSVVVSLFPLFSPPPIQQCENEQLQEEGEQELPLPPLQSWTTPLMPPPCSLPTQPLRPLPTRPPLGLRLQSGQPLGLRLQSWQQLMQSWQEREWEREQEREREMVEGQIDGLDLCDVIGDDEAKEVGVVGTGEGEMELNQLNSRCLGYEKSKEKTPGGVSGNKKIIGVRIASPFEDVLKTKDAAKELNVNFVDEERFSDTPPSDQASAVTVDTNSVVGKEIPPLQFSRTAQQKNPNEAFGNDEVEEGEIWAKTTEEGGTEGQFDSRCFAKRKRNEKSPRRERRNKKTTGVRIGTPLEDILQTEGRSLKEDAKHLKGVEPTKFKWRARLRQREIKVDDTPSSKKQLKSVKGGASQSTSRGGFAESNVDVNIAGGQTPSKKRSTSVIGKGEIKIKKPCSIEPTNETAFRSSLRGIITLIKELNLRTCHKEVLKKTPFWGIFEAIIENKLSPKQCRKSDKMIIKIINTYDPVAKIFRLGRESMKLTRADIVSIFGISCGNKFVDLKYCPKEKVNFVKRRKILEPRLTGKSLKQLLEKYLGSDENDNKEDVARLLCLYLFHTFLFPTGPTVKWVYLEHIEDLDRLRDYDWNTAIINELMSSIEKYHREPRKVTGCVMVLLYWLCEHTNLSKADHREHHLGIVKWNIPLVVSGLKEIRLKDLKPGQVVSRQANVAITADDEVPVVQDSVSSGDVSVSNQGNDACSGNGKRDEKTQGRERVCRSKLKRVHRDYNIHTSPPHEKQTLIGQSHPNESPAVVDQERIAQLDSDTLLPSNQNSSTSNTNSVTVRAKYNEGRIKFKLSWPWRKLELEQNVKKRLQLDAGTYSINYKDEDGEMTLICCDEDLEDHISSTSHQGTHSIDLFLSQSS